MDIPCDSGYGSAEEENDDEVFDNLEETVDEHLNEMEESPVSLERVSQLLPAGLHLQPAELQQHTGLHLQPTSTKSTLNSNNPLHINKILIQTL